MNEQEMKELQGEELETVTGGKITALQTDDPSAWCRYFYRVNLQPACCHASAEKRETMEACKKCKYRNGYAKA